MDLPTKSQKMTTIKEKTAILKKINDNPDMPLSEIAKGFGFSLSTLHARLKEYEIQHGRRRGRKNGSGRKIAKIS